jgi:hypothetical protein
VHRAAGRTRHGRLTTQAEDFFFEKKKQKTFANGPLHPTHTRKLGATRKRQKFFGSFFKKEHLSCFRFYARRTPSRLKRTPWLSRQLTDPVSLFKSDAKSGNDLK